jgi:hypothetical protein
MIDIAVTLATLSRLSFAPFIEGRGKAYYPPPLLDRLESLNFSL